MQVIILDKNLRQINKYDGEVRNGVFFYKTGGVFGIGAVEKKLMIDYESAIDEGKTKKVYLIFDGKHYTQLNFIQLYDKEKGKIHINDYLREYKLGEYAIDNMIDKPFDLSQLLPTIIAIIALISVIVLYFVSKNVQSVATINYQTYTATQQQQLAIDHYLANQSALDARLLNATIQALGSYSAATKGG